MSQKIRITLCVLVAIVAAVGITVNAYLRSLPDESETVKTTAPSEETVVGEHEQEPTELTDDTVVYMTPSGKKYHLTEACGYLKNSKTINKATKKEAVEKGLEPCSGCVK